MKIVDVTLVGEDKRPKDKPFLVYVTMEYTVLRFWRRRYSFNALITIYTWCGDIRDVINIDTGAELSYSTKRALLGHLKLKGIL